MKYALRFFVAAVFSMVVGVGAIAADETTVTVQQPQQSVAASSSTTANTDAAAQLKAMLMKYRWRMTIYSSRGGNHELEFREENGQLMVDIIWYNPRDNYSLPVTIDAAGTVRYASSSGLEMELKYDPKEDILQGTSTNTRTMSGVNQVKVKAEKKNEKKA